MANDEKDGNDEPARESLASRLFGDALDTRKLVGDAFKQVDFSAIADAQNTINRLAGPSAYLDQGIEIPNFEIDDSPQRTAQHTEAMAAFMKDLVAATQASLALTEQSRDDNARMERFTRKISLASFWISTSSLAVAIISVVVAIRAINS